MAAVVRSIVVVAMGAAALGGPDALRLLLAFAGRSPLVDVLIAVFVIAAVTAPVLGTMLLARFLRKPRSSGARGGGTRSGSPAGAGGGGPTGAAADMAADPFATMTLLVSLAVTFVVSACLLVLPLFQSGDTAPLAFAGAALAVLAAGRSIKGTLLASLAAIGVALVVPCIAVAVLDAPAQRLAVTFNNPLATVAVRVAIAVVVGTTLLALFFHFRKTILEMITPSAVACHLAVPPVAA
uniref:Uncharacterized protein n=1 Tax=Leersia perrieri TaxID=77586 RepID=A0A0D9WN01_9ORYZ